VADELAIHRKALITGDGVLGLGRFGIAWRVDTDTQFRGHGQRGTIPWATHDECTPKDIEQSFWLIMWLDDTGLDNHDWNACHDYLLYPQAVFIDQLGLSWARFLLEALANPWNARGGGEER
jgi:hypothetical protein